MIKYKGDLLGPLPLSYQKLLAQQENLLGSTFFVLDNHKVLLNPAAQAQ